MTRWKGVGMWLVIGAIIAGAGWGFRHFERPAKAAVSKQPLSPDEKAVLRVSGAMSQGQHPIQLDAEMARRALRDGQLQVVLPDGTSYAVRMERQETHGGGHWSVVGRVATAVGGQAMVLTFGPNAVFGILPTPDGHAMQVETHAGGLVTVAPAGGLTPRRKLLGPDAPDYRVPPAGPETESHNDFGGTMLADLPLRLVPKGEGDSANKTQTLTAQAAPPVSSAVDTTPVRIDVLAMYSPELVALRGSTTAAETEVANMFAIANQAHIDSSSRVRLNMVGLQEVALPAEYTNDEALDILTTGASWDVDFESLRDEYAADLAAFIRPHAAEEATCGASWLNGAGYQGMSRLEAIHGYVVANVAPCGPYVLAHELGHAMGSAHDRDSERGPDGILRHGAYAFSFGHRTDSYGTIMSDPGDRAWIGRFSSGDPDSCNGGACGVAERIDNVRSLNLMAPAIAAFRGPKDTLSIADARGSEASGWMHFAIRLSAPAPAEGLPVHVDITGGTATVGPDYFDSHSHDLTIPAGQREVLFPIQLRNELAHRAEIEGDETILVQLTGPAGVTVSRADATGVLEDDDLRPVVTLNIRAPDGVALPDNFRIEWVGDRYSDTETQQEWVMQTLPGLWSIQLPVALGAPFRFTIDPSIRKAAYMRVAQLDEVWEDRVVEVTLDKTYRVTGKITVAPGMNPSSIMPSLDVVQYVDGEMVAYRTAAFPNGDDTFEFYAVPGATIEAYVSGAMLPEAGNPAAFQTWVASIQNVRSDFTLSPVRSSMQSVVGRVMHVAEGQDAVVEFERFMYPPSDAVTLHWRTVDGTAKAGVHYVAANGSVTIAPDAVTNRIAIKTLDNADNVPGRTFDVVIDQVSGAMMFTRTIHVDINNDDRRTGGNGQRFTK